jgi:hypothetical protein
VNRRGPLALFIDFCHWLRDEAFESSVEEEDVRIAIDARMIKQGSMHGIARYVFQLLNGLKTGPSRHQFFIFVNRGSPLFNEEWPDHIQLVIAITFNW